MRTRMLAGLGVLLLGALARAQATLSVPDKLYVGDKIAIGYSNPQRAGQTITVTIDTGGFPQRNVVQVNIQLDGNGSGSASWTVPESPGLAFNAPDAQEVVRFPGSHLPVDVTARAVAVATR